MLESGGQHVFYPKLRNHVFRIDLDQGVYFEGFSGAFLLKGEGLWPWVEHLTAQLDGAHSWREIVTGLPRTHRAVVKSILKPLIEHGFAYNAAKDLAHQLNAQELDHYRDVIAYLGEFAPGAERRFELLRRAPLLVVGSGLCLTSALRALLEVGAEQVEFTDLADDPELTAHFLGPYATWPARLVSLAPGEAVARLDDGPYQAILYAGPLDHPFLPELATRCRLSGRLLLVGGVTKAGGVLLPALHRAGPACLECLLSTLTNHGLDLACDEQSPALQTLTSSRLVYEWLLWRTEIKPPAINGALVLIDSEKLTDGAHRVRPLPNCDLCRDHFIGSGVESPELLVDPFTGYLHAVGPAELEQAPLAQCAADLPPALAEPRIVAAAPDADQARREALRAGLERFLAHYLTPDRDGAELSVGHSQAEWVARGTLRIAERELVTAARRGEWRAAPLHLGPNAGAESHRLYKALRLWFGLAADLYGCQTPWGAAAGVASDGRWLAVRAGINLAHAAYEALQTAVLTVIHQTEPELVCKLDPVASRVTLDEPGGEMPDWQIWFDAYGRPAQGVPVSLPGPVGAGLCGGWLTPGDMDELIRCPAPVPSHSG